MSAYLALAMAAVRLDSDERRKAIEAAAAADDLVLDPVAPASRFLLRGIGMTDAAIAASLAGCAGDPIELPPA